MFFHVYADLVMLAKSKKLNKSAIDMNTHYLELQMFLKELIRYPEIIMDEHYHVFKSELQLYGANKEVNHCLHVNSKQVHQHLFTHDDMNESLLFPLVATAMELKLRQYGGHHLPGGIYWDPDPSIRAMLEELSPSNDVCESILGPNDYLSTAIPNMHQSAQSTLIQIKKNKTIQWLEELPQNQQDEVLDLAFACKEEIKEWKQEDEDRSKHRREKHMQEERPLSKESKRRRISCPSCTL